ncbi:MAG: hypothetical protein Q4B42_04340, partial [Oscillospiraceae bacterium]|nr:hypothetical protein [Oscillospiraceae bacterium]
MVDNQEKYEAVSAAEKLEGPSAVLDSEGCSLWESEALSEAERRLLRNRFGLSDEMLSDALNRAKTLGSASLPLAGYPLVGLGVKLLYCRDGNYICLFSREAPALREGGFYLHGADRFLGAVHSAAAKLSLAADSAERTGEDGGREFF